MHSNKKASNTIDYLRIVQILMVLLLLLSFSGCTESAVLDEMSTHSVEENIHSLNISVNAAEFIIRDSDRFYVKSNLKFLTVTENNGTLTVKEETKLGVTYNGPILVLHMPTDTLFDRISIKTGAGTLTASELNTKLLDMQLGAGDISISKLHVESDADIEGGAGKITISDGSIRNLELEMGVGKLSLAAELLGKSDLSLGVGASEIQLLGGKDAYRIDIEKGLGKVTVDGVEVTDFGSSGSGENSVDIEGGVGSVNIRFSY